jgi:sulfocyanin
MFVTRSTLAGALSLSLALTVPALAQGSAADGRSKPDSTWLRWNPTTRTTSFKLIAGIPGHAKSPFNFNGYTDGDFTLVVPENTTLVLNFVNEDGTPHSAQVIADTKPIPNMALNDAAIPRAYSKAVSEGIAQFGTDNLRFKAAPAGNYLIFCGVPGHGLSGMWIRLKVSPDATTPEMMETPTGK